MERLTKRYTPKLFNISEDKDLTSIKHYEHLACETICENRKTCAGCPIQECIEKLAEYEDTGLEPDEIYDLQKNIRNLQIKYDSLNKSFDAKVKDYYHLQDQFMEALAQVGIITIHGEK